MSQIWISDFWEDGIDPSEFMICENEKTGDGYYVRTHHLDILAPYRYRTITLYSANGQEIEQEFEVDINTRQIRHVQRPTWVRLGHLDDRVGRK